MPTPPKVTISACLIVRDEAAMLADCLRSIAGADEIVVVDTGSTDATRAIAATHGAHVAETPWTDDFAAARNVSLSLATGDWVLVIDADQRLVGGVDAIRTTLHQLTDDRTVLCPVIRNLAPDGEPVSSYRAAQVFRRLPGRRYVGCIHERLVDDDGPTPAQWVTGWHLDHLGFMPAIRADRDKTARNLTLLLRRVADEPDDADAWYYLGVEYQTAGRLDEARKAYERGLQASPAAYETHLLQVNLLAVLESQGAWAQVLERMNPWQAAGERFPDYWLIGGRAALRAGRIGDAQAWFRRAAAFGSEQPVAYETGGARTWKPAAYLALIAAEAGDWDRVRRLLHPWQAAAGRDPFLTRLYLHAGLIGHEPAAAVQALGDWLAAPTSLAVLDAADEVLQRFPAAIQALPRPLADLPGGRWLLARQGLRARQWHQVRAWAASPGLPSPGAALLTAWAAYGLGDWTTAAEAAAETCRLAPDLAEAWTLRGDVAAAAGDESAWDHWQQALDAGAAPGPLWDRMARQALATRDGRRAAALREQVRRHDPMHPLLWRLGDLANPS